MMLLQYEMEVSHNYMRRAYSTIADII